MVERDDPQNLRERKLQDLIALGLPALPTRFGPTRTSLDVRDRFAALEGQKVRVAGRLMRSRVMGKASFAHIQDRSGQVQLYFKRDVLGEKGYEYFRLLDVGDIIGAEGTVFRTRTGEISIEVGEVVLLAKAYIGLPDKWHGLTDIETRYRRRYLDLISNEQARRIFEIRTRLVSGIRRYLDQRDFLEVETPVLQPLYGGAAATPFTTRYDALDMTAYLRIADELYLKRLIVGGLERVYEISKDFRNEGFSRKHSPEFTMLELYQAYADYRDIMALFEDMIASVTESVLGTRVISFGEHAIDFTLPWRRLTIREAVQEQVGVDLDSLDDTALRTLLSARGVPTPVDAGRGALVEELVSTAVEPALIQPTLLYDYPVDFPGSLLAKRKPNHPELTERFEAYAGGMEFANAFTELNDPKDQLERMEEAARLAGEAHAEVDRDYILALEHGMPPTGGLGCGIDRLMILLTGGLHIRETILFPLLRPREDTHAEP